MARNLGTQDVSWFLDMYGKKQLDLDPPYQRRSVWSPRDKRFFIDTILNNYTTPRLNRHNALVVAIHAHTADFDFKKQLDRGRIKIVVHGGMELPDWMLQPNPKIIRIDTPVAAPAEVIEVPPGLGAE